VEVEVEELAALVAKVLVPVAAAELLRAALTPQIQAIRAVPPRQTAQPLRRG
jgi:hypothetical protein